MFKLVVSFGLMRVTLPFLFSSTNTSELILNAFSLFFVLDIDDLIYKYAVRQESKLQAFFDEAFTRGQYPVAHHGRFYENYRVAGISAFLLYSLLAVYQQCPNFSKIASDAIPCTF